jgi:cell division protein FtsI (penicillin-binding protein 3)
VIDSVNDIRKDIELVSKDYKNYYTKVNSQNKTMPNLKNMSGMDAVSMLENMGLTVRFKGVGRVVSQSIKPGEEIDSKIIVELTLS